MSIERFGIRISPLAGFAEGYRTELTQLGYAPASVRLQLKVLADLGRTLETSAHVQRHRKRVRHDPPSHGTLKRLSLEQDCARHDLQARPRR
jgi:hypothetical protein